jgi:hypothetical protein
VQDHLEIITVVKTFSNFMEYISMKTKIAQALKKIALGGALAAVATTGFAATQGVTGFTSSGDLDITLTVTDEVRINNLVDIILPPFTGADVVNSSDACVYRNGGATYQVTATGSGAGNAFTLTDGVTPVNYSVTFDDGTGALGMTSGASLSRTNATGTDDSCVTNGGDNSTIEVTVAAVDANSLPEATYIGTLTFLVAPI